MGTKNNPSSFDCYAKAEPDEPMFILLARDPAAADLVRMWFYIRSGKTIPAKCLVDAAVSKLFDSGKELLTIDSPKVMEADELAEAMDKWRAENRPAKNVDPPPE